MSYLENRKRISKACQEIGITPNQYRYWMRTDPVFYEWKQEADEFFVQELKAKAYEIALTGMDPQFLLSVIEREDESWDLRLRHVKQQAAKQNLEFVAAIENGTIQENADPFALPSPSPAQEPSSNESTSSTSLPSVDPSSLSSKPL